MADGDNSATGGLLVVLGIIVAVALGYFFFSGKMGGAAPSAPSVSVTVPGKSE